jgi:hypothetical protein
MSFGTMWCACSFRGTQRKIEMDESTDFLFPLADIRGKRSEKRKPYERMLNAEVLSAPGARRHSSCNRPQRAATAAAISRLCKGHSAFPSNASGRGEG